MRTAAVAGGSALLPLAWSCEKDDSEPVVDSPIQFKYLEVSGSHYEVGKQIGEHFSKEIAAAQIGVSDIINAVKSIVQAAPEVFYDPFLEAAQTHYPDYVDELQGIADGAGMSLKDVMSTNMMMEILYHHAELTGVKDHLPGPNLGCSTLAYAGSDRHFMAHNEDLFTSFINSMYTLKISVSGKPEFMGLCYPGILPGMPPNINEAGIIQVGNDISCLHIKPEVPMVFHFRSVMDAESLDDAVSRASFQRRARTMTHTIGSIPERKIISVEAAPDKHETKIIDGFYVHTNHFVLPEMLDIALDPGGMPSSTSRFDILTQDTQAYESKPELVNSDLLTRFLSGHQGADVPPCVHDVHGASTLAHAVFDFDNSQWKLFYSNPCLNNTSSYGL